MNVGFFFLRKNFGSYFADGGQFESSGGIDLGDCEAIGVPRKRKLYLMVVEPVGVGFLVTIVAAVGFEPAFAVEGGIGTGYFSGLIVRPSANEVGVRCVTWIDNLFGHFPAPCVIVPCGLNIRHSCEGSVASGTFLHTLAVDFGTWLGSSNG